MTEGDFLPYNVSERVAKAAYDSADAGAFYSQIWGGDDIHLGLYETPEEPIADASHRTMERMVSKIQQDSIDYVVDLGSGYGGAARYLQAELNSRVLAVNLSGEQIVAPNTSINWPVQISESPSLTPATTMFPPKTVPLISFGHKMRSSMQNAVTFPWQKPSES